jgi:hypothetical protein
MFAHHSESIFLFEKAGAAGAPVEEDHLPADDTVRLGVASPPAAGEFRHRVGDAPVRDEVVGLADIQT